MAADFKAIMTALVRGVPWSQITSGVGCSRASVDKAANVIKAHGFDEDMVAALTPAEVAELFPDDRLRDAEAFLQPDFTRAAQRVRDGQKVTMKIEHERYLEQKLLPGQQHYSYRQFCRLWDKHVDEADLVVHITHCPGEEMYVDWSGDGMHLVDVDTGTLVKAQIFVAVLPFSGLLHVSAWPNMTMRSWLSAHQEAFEYFGGRPKLIVPDNASTATNQLFQDNRAREVNPTYFQFCQHFGASVIPARSNKPRDKAAVETAVGVIQRDIIEYLADLEFYTFGQLNRAIAERVDVINDRVPFRQQDRSRREIFTAEEDPRLDHRPVERWQFSTTHNSKVRKDYHIQLGKHFYSVPWRYANQWVKVKVYDDFLDIFADNELIAHHQIGPRDMGYSTIEEHMPDKHRELAGRYTRDQLESRAKSIGVSTHELICRMFNAHSVETNAYSSVISVLDLARDYSRTQLETACQMILDQRLTISPRQVGLCLKQLKNMPLQQPDATPVAPTSLPASTEIEPRRQSRPPTRLGASHIRGKQAFRFRTDDTTINPAASPKED